MHVRTLFGAVTARPMILLQTAQPLGSEPYQSWLERLAARVVGSGAASMQHGGL